MNCKMEYKIKLCANGVLVEQCHTYGDDPLGRKYGTLHVFMTMQEALDFVANNFKMGMGDQATFAK